MCDSALRRRSVPLDAVSAPSYPRIAGAAAHSTDAPTPCLVGGAPYYKLWGFDESVLLRSTRNAIYTFDYFVPAAYVFGTGSDSSTDVPGW